MSKCFAYVIYHYFFDTKRIYAIVFLIILNVINLYFYVNIGTESKESTEIFGNNMSRPTQTVSNTISSSSDFYENLRLVCETAEKNINRAGAHLRGNYYEYEKNVLDIYTALSTDISIEDINITNSTYFYYSYDIIYLVFSIFLFMIVTYEEDYSVGLLPILRTTKCGRLKLALAKQLALCMYIAISVIVFSCTSLLIVGQSLPLSAPVQVLPGMALAPFAISVGQYFFMTCAIKIVVLTAFALLILPVLLITYRIIWSSFFCLAFSGIQYFLSLSLSTATSVSAFHPLNYINLYTLSAVMPLTAQYRAVSCFDKLYSGVLYAVVVWVSVILVAFICNAFIYCLRRPQIHIISRISAKHTIADSQSTALQRIPIKFRSNSLSLFRHEGYKLIAGSYLYLILIILLICSGYVNFNQNYRENVNERIYKKYMTSYSGTTVEESLWSKSKSKRIASEATQLETEKEIWDDADKQFQRNQISLKEYERILTLYADIDIRREVFTKIEQYDDYLISKDSAVSFVYDTGWNAFFTREPDVFLYIGIVLLAACLFSDEYSVGMVPIIKATRYGRKKLFKVKLTLLLICSFVCFSLFESSSLIAIFKNYELPLPSAAAMSLMLFQDLDYSVTLWELALQAEMLRLFFLLGFALMCGCISELSRKKFAVIFFGIGILLFPVLIEESGGKYFRLCSYYTLSGGGTGLLLSFEHSIDLVYIMTTLLLLILVIIFLIRISYRSWNGLQKGVKG